MEYLYKGYRYEQEIDEEEDNRKIFHDVYDPSGKRLSFSWSPYSTPTIEEFQAWIKLGCPESKHNLDRAGLIKLIMGESYE